MLLQDGMVGSEDCLRLLPSGEVTEEMSLHSPFVSYPCGKSIGHMVFDAQGGEEDVHAEGFDESLFSAFHMLPLLAGVIGWVMVHFIIKDPLDEAFLPLAGDFFLQ